MTTATVRREVPMMAAVNGVIDDLHGSLGLGSSEFFCECDHIGCRERIELTREQYERLRADGRPVLVPAHVHRDYRELATLREIRSGTLAAVESTDEKVRT